ncbi:hypothetical protein V5J35_001072 [Endozoicomonas sp. NE40]|uniref:Transposase DDE domain-containing protein n=1 Tax=Endozoicomonas lisbonensis TaxID=3120522 RepID=A0ABV2SDP5_9GAMM
MPNFLETNQAPQLKLESRVSGLWLNGQYSFACRHLINELGRSLDVALKSVLRLDGCGISWLRSNFEHAPHTLKKREMTQEILTYHSSKRPFAGIPKKSLIGLKHFQRIIFVSKAYCMTIQIIFHIKC